MLVTSRNLYTPDNVTHQLLALLQAASCSR